MKRKTIRVCVKNLLGEVHWETRVAVVHGDYAVHLVHGTNRRTGSVYSCTHIPSGHAVKQCIDRELAVKLALAMRTVKIPADANEVTAYTSARRPMWWRRGRAIVRRVTSEYETQRRKQAAA